MASVLDKIARKESNQGQLNAAKAAGQYKQEKEREAHAKKAPSSGGGEGGKRGGGRGAGGKMPSRGAGKKR